MRSLAEVALPRDALKRTPRQWIRRGLQRLDLRAARILFGHGLLFGLIRFFFRRFLALRFFLCLFPLRLAFFACCCSSAASRRNRRRRLRCQSARGFERQIFQFLCALATSVAFANRTNAAEAAGNDDKPKVARTQTEIRQFGKPTHTASPMPSQMYQSRPST